MVCGRTGLLRPTQEITIIRDTAACRADRTCEQFRAHACMDAEGVQLQREPQQTERLYGARAMSLSLLLLAP